MRHFLHLAIAYRFMEAHDLHVPKRVPHYILIENIWVHIIYPARYSMGKLCDIQIRNWIRANERFAMRDDENGLYLRYRKVDSCPLWRFLYRFDNNPWVMNTGSYATGYRQARRAYNGE